MVRQSDHPYFCHHGPDTKRHLPLLPLFTGTDCGAVPEDVPPQPPQLHAVQGLAGALPGLGTGQGRQLPGTGALHAGVMAHGNWGGIVHVIPKSTHFLWNICIWSIKYYGVSYPYVGNFSITLYFTQSHYIYIHIIVYGVSNTIHQLPFSWHIQVGRECWEERFVSSKMSLPLSPQGQLSQGPTEPAWISQPWFGSEKACFSPCVYQQIW